MELVAGEGFSVAGAGSLREARERVAERRPDVALLDLELPDGNGMDLFGDVKSRATTEVSSLPAMPALRARSRRCGSAPPTT